MATRKPKAEPVDAEEVHADEATGEIIDAETEDIPFAEAETPPTPTHLMTSLPRTSDMTQWSDEQAALLDAAGLVQRKRGQAPAWAPRATVAAFLQQCARTGLDPIARQIYCIERAGKWQIQISIDGARLIAQRSGEYRGQTPAQWTGDGVQWFDVWLFDAPPRAARVGVHREGFVEPLYAVARWDSYAVFNDEWKDGRRTGNKTLTSMWAKMPDVMLAKVAEMLALRKAFPQDLSGLYSSEEMDQAGPSTSLPAIEAGPQAPAAVAVISSPDRPSTEPQGDARWIPWKNLIDNATVDRLEAVATDAANAGILGLQVPGQSYTVGDYITARHGELVDADLPAKPKPRSVKDRVAAGLKSPSVVEEAEAAIHEAADHD
jgi:phage recombination protein Bet